MSSFIKYPGGLKKHLIRGGMYASSAKVFMMLAGFTIQIIIARLLGPEQLGVYFLFLSVCGVCVYLVKAGLDRALLRLVAEANGKGDWGSVKGLVKTGITMVTAFGVIVSFLLWLFSGLIGNNMFGSSMLAGALSVGFIIVLFMGLQGLIVESFRGLHAIGRASYFQGPVSSAIFLIVLLVFWLKHVKTSLDMIIIIYTVALSLSVCVAVLLLWRLLRSRPAETKKIDLKNLFSLASPMLVTSGAVFVLGQMDIFILGMFANEADVGYYGSASRLAAMVAFILLIINANIPPLMAELYKKGDKEKLERITRTAATLGMGVCLPVSLVLIIWGDMILEYFYGVQFVEGANALSILAVGKFVHVSAGSSGMLLQMTGHHKTLMYISLFFAVLSLIGFSLVIHPYGKEGVAVIATTMLILQNVLQLFYAKKLTGIWTAPALHNIFKKNVVKI